MITFTTSIPYSDVFLYAAIFSTVHQGLKKLYRYIWNHAGKKGS